MGAIDGKHIVMMKPAHCGSDYYNYKHSHSIVLLAACDANLCFTIVDIGSSSRQSDGGIFASSEFGKKLKSNKLMLPEDQSLPGTSTPPQPFCFVGDEAFPLLPNLQRPFPGRDTILSKEKAVYCYRLSRARRCIENAFGVMVARWQILKKPLSVNVDNVVRITKACTVLHNYCKVGSMNKQYISPGFIDSYDSNGKLVPGYWRRQNSDCKTAFSQTNLLSSNAHSRDATATRAYFANYFLTEHGRTTWQDDAISHTFVQ